MKKNYNIKNITFIILTFIALITLLTNNINLILAIYLILILFIISNILFTKKLNAIFKSILSIPLLLVFIWLTIIFVDHNKGSNLEEPIFAKETFNDNLTYNYNGFGYKISFVKGNGYSEYNLYIFDRLIDAWIS